MNLPTDKQERKERPITSGVLDYFPDAIAEIAHVSKVGNDQHNPGEKMHWSRAKSSDHADCIARHLIERGTIDTDGLRHTAKAAWRALALLQEEIEKVKEFQADPITLKPTLPIIAQVGEEDDARRLVCQTLINQGCRSDIAAGIAKAMAFASGYSVVPSWVYIAGPMRGLLDNNFPAFDKAKDYLRSQNYNVISPADIDRWLGFCENPQGYVYRDTQTIQFVSNMNGKLAVLPGWEKSTGASAEVFLARWLGMKIIEADYGMPLRAFYGDQILDGLVTYLEEKV
jgi:hypothetical protein